MLCAAMLGGICAGIGSNGSTRGVEGVMGIDGGVADTKNEGGGTLGSLAVGDDVVVFFLWA